jgi:hypothetical protein
MAAEIGVSPKVLGDAERGVVPRPANQAAIARAYGLDVVVQWPEEEAAA